MFDSLKCAKILEDTGLPKIQAEAHIQVIGEVLEMNLTTKQEFQEFRNEMKQDFQKFRYEILLEIAKLRNEMQLLEQRMTIKVGAIVSVIMGIAVTILASLPK